MKSAICTLFEGDYHYGVGALANSLYAYGFRGTIYAGHRGRLPPWANTNQTHQKSLVRGHQSAPTSVHRSPASGIQNSSSEQKAGNLEPRTTFPCFSPAPGLDIVFIPVATNYHLTNYKPDFMLKLWTEVCPDAEELFYFDPDIIVRFPWSFFEEWASDAVALCEDVNSPMPSTHPKRNAWRRALASKEYHWINKMDIYVNGGFIGIPRACKDFLTLWSQIIQDISQVGIDLNSLFTGNDYRFQNNDQDALNIAAMITFHTTSCAGKDGMGFIPTYGLLSHSIGSPKPWSRNHIKQSIAGRPPSQADRDYWANTIFPIQLVSLPHIRWQRFLLNVTALIGRFYKRK